MRDAAAALDGNLARKRMKSNTNEIGGEDSLPEDMTDVPNNRDIAASRDGARRSKAKK